MYYLQSFGWRQAVEFTILSVTGPEFGHFCSPGFNRYTEDNMKTYHSILKLIFCTFVALIACAPGSAVAKDPPYPLPEQAELNKLRSGIISTSRGELVIELYPEDAPWHVANFKYLADKGFYRNTRFHLHYENYIIQGGSPSNDPNDGPGYSLPAEFNDRRHEPGTIGMARIADSSNPQRRSNGSQFHILLSGAPQMDGSFTVFGKVVSGMEVLDQLRRGDVIEDVTVYVRKTRRALGKTY